MGFQVNFDCPLFSLELHADADPSPDILDNALTRFNRAVSDSLANVAPHAALILGDDNDDD